MARVIVDITGVVMEYEHDLIAVVEEEDSKNYVNNTIIANMLRRRKGHKVRILIEEIARPMTQWEEVE